MTGRHCILVALASFGIGAIFCTQLVSRPRWSLCHRRHHMHALCILQRQHWMTDCIHILATCNIIRRKLNTRPPLPRILTNPNWHQLWPVRIFKLKMRPNSLSYTYSVFESNTDLLPKINSRLLPAKLPESSYLTRKRCTEGNQKSAFQVCFRTASNLCCVHNSQTVP